MGNSDEAMVQALHDDRMAIRQERDRLRAENARLREALEAVAPLVRRKADAGYCMHDEYSARSAADLYGMLRAALAAADAGQGE